MVIKKVETVRKDLLNIESSYIAIKKVIIKFKLANYYINDVI